MLGRVSVFLCALLMAAVLAGPASAQETAATLPATEGYTLGAGDRVRVIVFEEDLLSGEFELDGEGSFSMPLIGTVDAEGLTPRQLEDRIAELLLDGYLKNPRVSIEVLNYRPFYIIGEVNNPGAYPYKSGMTILNAAALAGGFTYRADEDEVLVTRGGVGEPVEMAPSAIVQPGDIIRVTESIF